MLARAHDGKGLATESYISGIPEEGVSKQSCVGMQMLYNQSDSWSGQRLVRGFTIDLSQFKCAQS